jgi:hypothetical protein
MSICSLSPSGLALNIRTSSKVIEALVFDWRLTPIERLGGLAFLALVDPDTYECDASNSYVARTFGLSRDLLDLLERQKVPQSKVSANYRRKAARLIRPAP